MGLCFDIEPKKIQRLLRYLDTAIGRFITADSRLGAWLTSPNALNRSTFGLNDPVNFTDPSGHGVFDWVFSAIIDALESMAGAIADVFDAQPLGNGLIGTGVGGLIYEASTAPSGHFSWAQWGVSEGIGAVIGLTEGASAGAEGAAPVADAAEDGLDNNAIEMPELGAPRAKAPIGEDNVAGRGVEAADDEEQVDPVERVERVQAQCNRQDQGVVRVQDNVQDQDDIDNYVLNPENDQLLRGMLFDIFNVGDDLDDELHVQLEDAFEISDDEQQDWRDADKSHPWTFSARLFAGSDAQKRVTFNLVVLWRLIVRGRQLLDSV